MGAFRDDGRVSAPSRVLAIKTVEAGGADLVLTWGDRPLVLARLDRDFVRPAKKRRASHPNACNRTASLRTHADRITAEAHRCQSQWRAGEDRDCDATSLPSTPAGPSDALTRSLVETGRGGGI